MQPSGRVEQVQVSVGLYFTNEAPTRTPLGLRLGSETIDIAPGDAAYQIADSYLLPVDAQVFAVQPHAHNLGREMIAEAVLPDGSVRRLITITDWDFRWQDVYRYATPIDLPRGSTIRMRFTYDNSAANPRNVEPRNWKGYGYRTIDDMSFLLSEAVYLTDEEFKAEVAVRAAHAAARR
jgi:hypothetical protein